MKWHSNIPIGFFLVLSLLLPGSGGVAFAFGNDAIHFSSREAPDPVQSRNPREAFSAESAARGGAGTFVEKLDNAPYPYAGDYNDSGAPFFDHIDAKTGERFHTNRYGERISEKDHYTDSRVLFHVPSCFNPEKPFAYVLFFHGINADVLRSNRDFRLEDQVDASGKNVILVAPQLARNASDSSPGKFFKMGAFKAFMDEVAGVLPGRLKMQRYSDKFAQAPIILTAFSGGYKSVAFILDRGGLDSRIKGVFLMDALYEDVDKFKAWLPKHAQDTFFVGIYTPGACEKNMKELAAHLTENGIHAQRTWPRKLSNGSVHFAQSSVEHIKVPLWGPPKEPLATLLRMVEP